jgi:hypothetical protein
MNAQIEPRAETTLGSVTTYSCTFGYYTQTGPWTDVRALAWPDLAALLVPRHSDFDWLQSATPARRSGFRSIRQTVKITVTRY